MQGLARVIRLLIRFWFVAVFGSVIVVSVVGALHKNTRTKGAAGRALTIRDATGKPQELAKDADQLTVVVILDTSGSMNGKVGARTKMAIAQEVLLEEFVPLLADSTHLALVTFESDHGALQVSPRKAGAFVKPRWTQREWVMQAIERARPGSMTPIYACLRGTDRLLRGSMGRKVVVLITDGEETYATHEDVLAAIDDAKGAGIETFVIGFQLGAEGKYLESHLGLDRGFFRANSGRAGLQRALNSVLATIEQ